MSQQFSPTDPYLNVELRDLHLLFYEPDGGAFFTDSESDPSMVMPTYSFKMNPSKPTSPFSFPFDYTVASTTMENRVNDRGHG